MTLRDPRPPHEELVSHAGFLRALARGMLADEHLADDVVQQAFLRALARPPAERGLLRAWLARVVRNLALNEARGAERRRARERLAARADVDGAHERAALELTLQREVAAALAELGEPYRTVVHLRYFRGLSLAAIARELDLTAKVVETRLAHAQAALHRRLTRAWNAQDERARAVWLAALPSAKFLTGVLMTKQLLLVGVGGALLVGLVLTWRALDGGGARAEAPVLVETPLEVPRALIESIAVVEREPVASEPESPSDEPAPEALSDRDTELRASLEELGLMLDRSLDGGLDPGAILDASLLVLEHELGTPESELDETGRLRIPLEGMPEGVQAALRVSKPNRMQEKLLTLEITLPRRQPVVFENMERDGASVQVTTRTNASGELVTLSILTDLQPMRRATGLVDPPQMTMGHGLFTPLADPTQWKLSASGLREVEGSLQPDGGRSYKSGDWEVPQVLGGGPWPRVEDIRRFSRRLQELHATAKQHR